MLPVQYRMTRSTEFSATVKSGARAAQPDLVVHMRRDDAVADDGPRVGLVVTKSVGNAVQRHRVARRLRHVARRIIDELEPSDRVVIRALPGCRDAVSARLEEELRAALKRTNAAMNARR